MQLKKIAIFEHKFHEELLLPQINLLLHQNYQVHLITSEKIAASDSLNSVRDKLYIKCYINTAKITTKLKMLVDIPRYIKHHRVRKVIFNTMDSKFCQILASQISPAEIFGFIHNGDKFLFGEKYHSFQKKIKKAMVLNVYISQFLKQNGIEAIPTYLSDFEIPAESTSQKQNDEPIKIVIPGQLDNNRRDYNSLIDACTPDLNIQFILLGNAKKNDGPKIIEKIHKKNLAYQFQWFDNYVPHKHFTEILNCSDYIMPLIHRNCLMYERYLTCKTTAAYMWATAFNKKMLLESGSQFIEEFQLVSQYYESEQLHSFMCNLKKPTNENIVPEQFHTLQNNYMAVIESREDLKNT